MKKQKRYNFATLKRHKLDYGYLFLWNYLCMLEEVYGREVERDIEVKMAFEVLFDRCYKLSGLKESDGKISEFYKVDVYRVGWESRNDMYLPADDDEDATA